jgi:hypothetical protein
MTLAYRCAIAPLDQSTTSLGWLSGFYRRDPCGLADCNWWDSTMQFLADPGTPMVAPFPMTVISTTPFLLRVDLPWTDTYGRMSQWGTPGPGQIKPIRIRGATPAVRAGQQLAKGDLLGRVAAGERGVKWGLWDNTFTPLNPVGRDVDGIEALFRDVGLYVVGSHAQDMPGFARTPSFGGHLLARSGGTADCPPDAAASSGVHGLGRLEAYFGDLGTGIAPAGYVEPSSGPYARFGPSAQADASAPRPRHENVVAESAGIGLALAVAAALGAWWYSRR